VLNLTENRQCEDMIGLTQDCVPNVQYSNRSRQIFVKRHREDLEKATRLIGADIGQYKMEEVQRNTNTKVYNQDGAADGCVEYES